MSENMKLWNALCQPPADALKRITGGRLNGKTDINPMWRIKAMTEQFGPCGNGWGYEIIKVWMEPGADGEIAAFAHVEVWVAGYGSRIPGIGGSMFVANEKAGPYTSDEAYKMAVTDALSVALKNLGVAADIYLGRWDGSKYVKTDVDVPKGETGPTAAESMRAELITFIDEKVMGGLITQAERPGYVKRLDDFAPTVPGMTAAKKKLAERFPMPQPPTAKPAQSGADEAFGEPKQESIF